MQEGSCITVYNCRCREAHVLQYTTADASRLVLQHTTSYAKGLSVTVYKLDANEQCGKYTSADAGRLSSIQHANAEAAKPPWCSIQLQM